MAASDTFRGVNNARSRASFNRASKSAKTARSRRAQQRRGTTSR